MDRTTPSTLPENERASLESWLDFHRATLLLKCDGLSPVQLATASCPPSGLSLLGLVRHMVGVEPWFHSFDTEADLYPYDDEDVFAPDPRQADSDLGHFRAAVERSRRAVADRDLTDVIELPHWVGDDQPKEIRPTSLRWVYQHMIEEYARHNGHADLLRERIDGVVGD